jgi:CRP-like cAMP-binding protein
LNGYGSQLSTRAGQVIIREGEPQTSLYIVIAGLFNVTVHPAAHDVLLDTVGAGDCFGEVSIFQPGPASATVTSVQDGRLWYMGVANLQQYLFDYPYAGCAMILGINTILTRRLKRANSVIKTNEIVPSFLSVRSKRRMNNAQSS